VQHTSTPMLIVSAAVPGKRLWVQHTSTPMLVVSAAVPRKSLPYGYNIPQHECWLFQLLYLGKDYPMSATYFNTNVDCFSCCTWEKITLWVQHTSSPMLIVSAAEPRKRLPYGCNIPQHKCWLFQLLNLGKDYHIGATYFNTHRCFFQLLYLRKDDPTVQHTLTSTLLVLAAVPGKRLPYGCNILQHEAEGCIHEEQRCYRPRGDTEAARQGRLHCERTGSPLHAQEVQNLEETLLWHTNSAGQSESKLKNNERCYYDTQTRSDNPNSSWKIMKDEMWITVQTCIKQS